VGLGLLRVHRLPLTGGGSIRFGLLAALMVLMAAQPGSGSCTSRAGF